MKAKLIFSSVVILAFIYFIGLYNNYLWLKVITKPLPILLLLLLINPKGKYNIYIIAGFLFSALGDILLELPYHLFVGGLLAFLVAHIFYTLAFFSRSKETSIFSGIVLLLVGLINYVILFPGLANMAVPVAVYMSFILIMLWRAFAQRSTGAFANYAFWGALIFVVSDSIIAYNRFYSNINYAQWYIMCCYWLAQALIFVSAYKNSSAHIKSRS